MHVREPFRRFAHRVSAHVGSPWAFTGAMVIIGAWALTGPVFHYSDTWQLVINTGTTIVTFLMVFLIQNTQNRDAQAIHLKLDELIRATKAARNALVALEELDDAELATLQKEFEDLRAHADRRLGHVRDERAERRSHARGRRRHHHRDAGVTPAVERDERGERASDAQS